MMSQGMPPRQAVRLRSPTGQFPQIISRLTGMVDRFTSMLDCVELGFLPDGILGQLPAPSRSERPASAGSRSTSRGFVLRSPPCLRLRSPRKGSPSPSSPHKSER